MGSNPTPSVADPRGVGLQGQVLVLRHELRETIETACAESGGRAEAAIAAALALLDAEPALVHLIASEPPAGALRSARRRLVAELGAMLTAERGEQLVGAGLGLVARQERREAPLRELAPLLVGALLGGAVALWGAARRRVPPSHPRPRRPPPRASRPTRSSRAWSSSATSSLATSAAAKP